MYQIYKQKILIVKEGQTTEYERNLRVYAKLDMPYAEWIQIKEGYIDIDSNIKLS